MTARKAIAAIALAAIFAVSSLAAASGKVATRVIEARATTTALSADAEQEPVAGILMGKTQMEHWQSRTTECPKVNGSYCADEISQGQFVAWPFIAEHTGTVDAIFAVLGTSSDKGAEVGIYANRKYSYAEIKYTAEPASSKETWTPARFGEYEAEIPPEDPGQLLGASGKVPEHRIKNKQFTDFRLITPVKVVKGEKYWLANTTFAAPHKKSPIRIYQKYFHEMLSTTGAQPWGDYSNEPTNWASVVRPLKELPSPETTKINCEKCNTEGWLQEEPKGFELVNPNREAQEEGGQTFSYAQGEIEEGPTEGGS